MIPDRLDPQRQQLGRLYNLLPAIYRIRDAEQGYPLWALLEVVAEQVGVLEADIQQLYDNWFIETAQDWAVPYIAELIGYRSVQAAGDPNHSSAAENRALIPRREVAHTIRARRRKGTLALLEELAADIAGLPARAVEFYKLLSYFQPLNHLRPERGRTVDMRDGDALAGLAGPLDQTAHCLDVRRVSSLSPGRYNLAATALFVWKIQSQPISRAPAACLEQHGPNCFSFSILGNDAPLYTRAASKPSPDHIAHEPHLPIPIGRRALTQHLETYYGQEDGKSFCIWVKSKEAPSNLHRPQDWSMVPSKQIQIADLSRWIYRPKTDTVLVDPVLGRIAFPLRQTPAEVEVKYHYGFSAQMGGGEYPRKLALPLDGAFFCQVSKTGFCNSIKEALGRWELERVGKPRAVIEIVDSGLYSETLDIRLNKGEHLEIRAANRKRPVIHLLNRHLSKADPLMISTGQANPGGCLTLSGLLISGRAVHLEGNLKRLRFSHCTLVPGWTLEADCEPKRVSEPSLELWNSQTEVIIEHSIVGAIHIYQNEVTSDPLPLSIHGSIVDATHTALEAIGAPGEPLAHTTLNLRNCTVVGQVQAHAIELAENTIFTGQVQVARSQMGFMRFCYIPSGSRTPRRFACEQEKQPKFVSTRYGHPGYAWLAQTCPPEIYRGAEDESEMGVFHDLFMPQRLANLKARLEEYTPAKHDVALILAD